MDLSRYRVPIELAQLIENSKKEPSFLDWVWIFEYNEKSGDWHDNGGLDTYGWGTVAICKQRKFDPFRNMVSDFIELERRIARCQRRKPVFPTLKFVKTLWMRYNGNYGGCDDCSGYGISEWEISDDELRDLLKGK